MTKKAAWWLMAWVVMLVLAPVTFAQGAPAAHGIDWIDFAAALALGAQEREVTLTRLA